MIKDNDQLKLNHFTHTRIMAIRSRFIMRLTIALYLLLSSMPVVVLGGDQDQHATRYQLIYDAIFDPKAVHDFNTGIIPSLAKGSASGGLDAIMKSIGRDFVAYWNEYKYKSLVKEGKEEEYVLVEPNQTSSSSSSSSSASIHDTIQVNCLQGNSKKSICMVDFLEPGLDFSIHAVMYELNQNIAPYTTPLQNTFTDDALLGVSFDIIINVDADFNRDRAPGLFARDSLVHVLEVFSTTLLTTDQPSPTWSIQERPTPLQLAQRNEILVKKQEIESSKDKAASIETMILSKHAAKRHHHHHTTSTSTNSSSHDLLRPHPSISIWTIEEYGIQPLQHLFLNGKLRGTTSEAGTIHAEAFVHPAMMAHTHPRNIVVIGDMPLALLKEILKYKDVEEVTLVGLNMDAVDLARFHMKELDRCFMDGEWRSCMEDERVVVVKDSTMSWLNKQMKVSKAGEGWDDADGRYDVILDGRGQNEDNADADDEEDFSGKIQYLMGSNSIVVFNTGSTPRQDVDLEVASDDISREVFLGAVMYEDSGFGFPALYDEPQAAPFDSTFVILFSVTEDESYYTESYIRYVRLAPTAIDLDMMNRFHKQEHLPTRHYDGSTHANYLIPSRAWENWYCESNLGKKGKECKEFLNNFYDPMMHHANTEVRKDPVKGRGLYAVNDIPKGAFINADDSHLNLHIHRYQWDELNRFVEEYPDAQMYSQLRDFFRAYGYQNEGNGNSGWTVSVANVNTFMNHACTEKARNAEPVDLSGFTDDGDRDGDGEEDDFSPLTYRRKNASVVTVAARNIKAGEELQMDYSPFRSVMTPEYAGLLQSFCDNGEGLVPVNDRDEL